ncbi:MAG: AI-2E family transporter [Bdellovibrionia bacterium]
MKPLRVGILLIGVLAVLAVAILVRNFLLLGFVGLLFSVLLSYPVGLLSRWMSRGLATLIVVILTLAATARFSAVLAPKISEQFQSALKSLPAAVNQVEGWFLHIQNTSPVAQLSQGSNVAERLGDRVSQFIDTAAQAAIPAAKSLVELLSVMVFVFVMAAFLVYQPESYRRGLKRFVPRHYEHIFDETFDRLGIGLRHWLGGIFMAMILMGGFCAAGLAIAGINDWLLLGSLTFLGTFVPYLGAISSAIPGLLVALSQSPRHFLYACIVYLGVHLIEGYIVQPFIMKRAVELKPVVLLMGQAILTALFGVLGAIVAAPLLVCIQITLEYLYVERHLEKGTQQKSALHKAA